jgi:hypothetical protein
MLDRHLVLVLGGIYGSIVQRGVLRCGRGGRVSPPRTPRQTLHDRRRRRRRLRPPPPGLVAVGILSSFFSVPPLPGSLKTTTFSTHTHVKSASCSAYQQRQEALSRVDA